MELTAQQSLTRPLDAATWLLLFTSVAVIATLIILAYRLHSSVESGKTCPHVTFDEIVLRLSTAMTEPDGVAWFRTFSTGNTMDVSKFYF